MSEEVFKLLLSFFKALGNEARLKIVGILANRECTVGELAAMLDLKEPTVSGHLAMLKELALVDVRAQGNHRIYSLNLRMLIELNKETFSHEKLAALVPAEETEDAFARRVFQSFVKGEEIIQFPASDKKMLVLLRWLASKFTVGERYPEKAVNEMLGRHNPDYATLRRMLVDYGFLRREKGIYWRVEPVSAPPEPAAE